MHSDFKKNQQKASQGRSGLIEHGQFMPSQFGAVPTLANTGLDTMARARASMQARQQASQVQQHLRQIEREHIVDLGTRLAHQRAMTSVSTQTGYSVQNRGSASNANSYVNRVDTMAAQRIARSLNPPTVDRVDTAEEFEKLPTGTFVRSGRYSGYKMDNVEVTLENGTVLQSRRDYEEYILRKYPYTGAMSLYHDSRYSPWNPQGIAVEGYYSVDALLFSMSGKAGLAFSSTQVAPYVAVGGAGGTPGFRLPGFGVGFSVSLLDKTSDRTESHNLNPVNGFSQGDNLNLGPVAFGRSQGLRQGRRGLEVDPAGYTSYGIGVGGGFSYRRELMRTYTHIFDIHPSVK